MKTLIISCFICVIGSLGLLVYKDAEAKRQQDVSQLAVEERLQGGSKINAVQSFSSHSAQPAAKSKL